MVLQRTCAERPPLERDVLKGLRKEATAETALAEAAVAAAAVVAVAMHVAPGAAGVTIIMGVNVIIHGPTVVLMAMLRGHR